MNIQKEKETPQTRKAFVMKKNTLEALYTYFVKNDTAIDMSAIVEDIRAEYERTAAKAQVNKDIYAAAREVLIAALTDTPKTAKEIFESNEWPEDFTQGKLNYALRALWSNDVCKIDNGKSANTYTRK